MNRRSHWFFLMLALIAVLSFPLLFPISQKQEPEKSALSISRVSSLTVPPAPTPLAPPVAPTPSAAPTPSTPPTSGFCNTVTQIPTLECEVLVKLYQDTSGANWTNKTGWLATDTPCTWYGVYCSGGRVTQLLLPENNLNGAITPELGNLTQLTNLTLRRNLLSGTIPPELGNLTNLTNLQLQFNQLTGQIPTVLGHLTKIITLYLNNNQFSGTIPAEFGRMTSTNLFILSDNQLIGSIPPQLGNLVNLSELQLHNNKLTGAIPQELANSTNLSKLLLDRNNFSGTIPPQLGRLTALVNLSVYSNSLSGSIPPELGNLTLLKTLILHRNSLTGSLPIELANLVNLVDLQLQYNQLTGSIPTQFGDLVQLQMLSLAGNQLTGEIPATLGNLSQLKQLHLNANQLSGAIPMELGNLTQLQQLDLAYNQLTGAIPQELGNLTSLTRLYLHGNNLSGVLPQTFGNLTLLKEFGVSRNPNLSGTLPLSWQNQPFTTFYFRQTGICEYDDTSFQSWLATLPVATFSRTGIFCSTQQQLHIIAFAADNILGSPASLHPLIKPTLDQLVLKSVNQKDRHAVVLADGGGVGDTHLYHIYNGQLETLLDLPNPQGVLDKTIQEYDMTDGEMLGGFIKWSLDRYALDTTRTIFSFVGHGTFIAPDVAIDGIFPSADNSLVSWIDINGQIILPTRISAHNFFTDEHPYRRFLTPYQLRRAFEIGTNNGQRPIDIADIIHCFSASLEQLHEVANPNGTPLVRMVIGSPNYAYFSPEMLATGFNAISPTQTVTESATIMATNYDAVLESADLLDGNADVEHPRSIIVVDPTKLDDIKGKMDELATELLADFDEDPLQTASILASAHSDAGMYYDTTYCSADFALDEQDVLVDAYAFMGALHDALISRNPLSGATSKTIELQTLLQEARVITIAQNGTPWYAPTAPAWSLDSSSRLGISLFSGFLTALPNTPVDLPWQALYYTRETNVSTPNDNPHPLAFFSETTPAFPHSWADLFVRYRQEILTSIHWNACLSNYLPLKEEGEVHPYEINYPQSGKVREDVGTLIVGLFTTTNSINTMYVEFSVIQNGTVVFTDTVVLTNLPAGSHSVQSQKLYTPTLAMPVNIELSLDTDNRIVETNENDNSVEKTFYVSSAAAFDFSAKMRDGIQLITSPNLVLDYTAIQPVTRFYFQLYQYGVGKNPSIYNPLLKYSWTGEPSISETISISIPASANLQTGSATLHVWAYSNGVWSRQPSIIHFNYAPLNDGIGINNRYYLMPMIAGQRFEIRCDDSSAIGTSTVKVYVHRPNQYWTADYIQCNKQIVYTSTRAGTYQIVVSGESEDSTYSLQTYLNNTPILRSAIISDDLPIEPEEIGTITRTMELFIEPLPDLPDLFVPTEVQMQSMRDSSTEPIAIYTAFLLIVLLTITAWWKQKSDARQQ